MLNFNYFRNINRQIFSDLHILFKLIYYSDYPSPEINLPGSPLRSYAKSYLYYVFSFMVISIATSNN